MYICMYVCMYVCMYMVQCEKGSDSIATSLCTIIMSLIFHEIVKFNPVLLCKLLVNCNFISAMGKYRVEITISS